MTKAAIDDLARLVNTLINTAATKDDLSNLATKADIQGLASKEDLKAMKEEVTSEVNELIDFKFGQMDEKLNATTAANNVVVNEYENRIRQVEHCLKVERESNRAKQIMYEMYNRRLNFITLGLDDDKNFESRDESESLVRDILQVMQVKNASTMKFIDCHRLPRKKKASEGEAMTSTKAFCRPIITRLDNMFDMNHIFDKLKDGLKLVNEHRADNNKVYIKRDLPKELLKQKQKLQDRFQELYLAKKSPRWFLDMGKAKFCIKGKNNIILAEYID